MNTNDNILTRSTSSDMLIFYEHVSYPNVLKTSESIVCFYSTSDNYVFKSKIIIEK